MSGRCENQIWRRSKLASPPSQYCSSAARKDIKQEQEHYIFFPEGHRDTTSTTWPIDPAYLVIPYYYRQTSGGCKLAVVDRAGGLSSCSHKALLKTDQQIVRHLLVGGCSIRYIYLGGWGTIIPASQISGAAPLSIFRPGEFQIDGVLYKLPHRQMSKCSSGGLYLGNKIAVPVK